MVVECVPVAITRARSEVLDGAVEPLSSGVSEAKPTSGIDVLTAMSLSQQLVAG